MLVDLADVHADRLVRARDLFRHRRHCVELGNSFGHLENLDLLELRRCQVLSLVIVRLYRQKCMVVFGLEPVLDSLNDHLNRVIMVDLDFITSKRFRRVLMTVAEPRPRHVAAQVECLEA